MGVAEGQLVVRATAAQGLKDRVTGNGNVNFAVAGGVQDAVPFRQTDGDVSKVGVVWRMTERSTST
ncbi:hypothetical protein CryarDRAFT_3343 [Cryptosporangium arvum DSM 44712]|uniref:Uncharacterized protein n=1 Tax=Cryptosporangium arvum DSM 44712 TaxID=927661 RepID=A0A010Z482_9ACTN|nr:hypothetical protein [Cryptosporangium arvum]EXG82193.1 hypothetical protein CryarDRAFT_3343 [Cryptosporangium arvum DSM 44712]